MRIDFKRRPALWASISLHLILLLLAALFTFISFPETPDSTHVFEMLASDGQESASSSPTPASTAKLPEPYAPKLKPLLIGLGKLLGMKNKHNLPQGEEFPDINTLNLFS